MSDIFETPIDEIDDVLEHHGIKGMKWGVRRTPKQIGHKSGSGIKDKYHQRVDKMEKKRLEFEKKNLMDDAANITSKADPGKTRCVVGKYGKKSGNNYHLAYHIVDDKGKVRFSQINGIAIASSKNYVDKHINLSDHFRNIDEMHIEYGVYDDDITHSMEDLVDDVLQHHGIKGMKWGVRRYQNKDGSLTPAGTKRYNKEMAKLTAEKKKLKENLKTRTEAQKKMDKMKKLKSEVEDLKEGRENPETVAEKRARLLKSTDPKEIYKDRDVLTYNELNERINRIDAEAKLYSKATADQAKTGHDAVMDKMDKTAKTIRTVTNLYKSVDEAYSTTMNSAIGKMVAKKLGIETPKKTYDINDAFKKLDKNEMSVDEIKELANVAGNLDRIDKRRNPSNNKNGGLTENDVDDRIEQRLRDAGLIN